MKKGLLAIALLITSTVFAAVALWTNDKAHSQLQFTVTHMGLSDISGTFNDFDVKVNASEDDFSDAVFELTAQVASIDTRVEARNNHLKSADFFDVEKFPQITYKSTAIEKNGENKYKLTGDLTIHGVTKSVTMDLLYRGLLTDEEGKQTAGFQLTGEISRLDFNVGPGFPEQAVSDIVRIKADGEFVKE